ncbi:MAG: hypothetical protein KGL39_20405 [Patescibacteria group bacterium]|nr:hypothetical protein [Patescibacteria group bacterium]
MIRVDSRTLTEAAGTAAVIGLAAARHMPAPKTGSVMYGWIFDTVQDLAKNNDRIGQRRPIPNLAAPTAGQEES